MSSNQSSSYYEGRIKAMSKLLSHVAKQVAPSLPGPAELQESQAYYHIATLLTRGCNNVGHARDVIAVTGVQRLASVAAGSERPGPDKSTQGGLPSSPDINSSLVDMHIAVAQNQPLEPTTRHAITRIEPSKTSVDTILKTIWYSEGNTAVSLEQHAAEIFAALASTSKLHRSTDGERYNDASYVALSIIIGRSFLKIARRVQALQYLFTSKFLDNLAKQELKQSEHLVVAPANQVRVYQSGGRCYIDVGKRLQKVFSSIGVPRAIHDAADHYLFDISSAMLWIRALLSVHSSVKALTQKRPTKKAQWHDLYIQLKRLHRMVYTLGHYYDAILSLPGLADFLGGNLQRQYSANYIYELSDSASDATADALSDIGTGERRLFAL